MSYHRDHDINSPGPPPLSEGPSPEAEMEAREIEIQAVALTMEIAKALALHLPEDFPQIETKRRLRAMVQPFLIALVAAAKREAHLEDARAGCQRCRIEGPPTSEERYGRRWWHLSVLDGGRVTGELPCARPEIWDALSLLPQKGTK